MAKLDVTQTGYATVNGKERPVRLLADGTEQWNNRSNPAKGKWTATTPDDTVVWTQSDGGVFEVEQPPVADDPEVLETEGEQAEADGLTEDDAPVPDDAGTPVRTDDTGFAFLVSATGARGLALLFAGETPDSKVPYLGFGAMDEVHRFLATNLRSAWALSGTAADADRVWKRRGVQLLTVHANDAGRTPVYQYDPRPQVEAVEA